MKSSTSWAKN